MTTTFGRYRLLERLGQGGMAEVWKAKSFGVEGFEKVIVIKRILPELAESKEFIRLFIHEAKLAVRLSHANIVQVFDLGIAPATSGPGTIPPPSMTPAIAGSIADPTGKQAPKQPDVYYMAMEYVHGFDLATLLTRARRKQESLPLDMCVFIAAEVAKGLDHAHRRRDEQMQPLGIVHRDVSPQNVLLSYEGEVKVTDFGIAKAKGVLEPKNLEDTQARKLQGKFGYMSPEQAAGEDVDARSDLFSLGTVLYECLTGVNPFSGPTTFETLRRVQAGEYPPASLLRPDLPKELADLLDTAMAKDPASRFQDAARMYEALLAFLYTRDRRFGSNQLAEYMIEHRAVDEAPAAPPLHHEAERTPLDAPIPKRSSHPSYPAFEGPKSVDLEAAAALGERREITALVVSSPTRESSKFATRAAATLERYGGRIVSHDPAQVTALFGLFEPDGRDTEMAARAALKLVRLAEGNHLPSAGVHSARIQVSATGEPFDDERLASLVGIARDLSRAKEGRVAISVPAMKQVRSLFVFETMSDAIAGLSASTTLFVRNVRDPHEAFGRFVGRREELRVIGNVLAHASKRHGSVLTIRGEHGIGKTRLLVEIERRLGKLGYNVGFYVANCPPGGAEHPLSGVVALLQALCGTDEADPPELIRTVKPRLRAVGLGEDEIAATLDALGAGEAGERKSVRNLTESLRAGLVRIVQSLAEDRPHVFAWDEAHALDSQSYSIIVDTLAKLQLSRVVFAFSVRGGYTHPLVDHEEHTLVELVDLSAEDTERLIASRLGVERPPHELVRFVRERAGGHPQFVEEVIRALADARAITVAKGAILQMRLVGQELALPKTLRGLVASRVARLDAGARAVLQSAAILGDPLHLDVLAQMVAMPLDKLEGIIDQLERTEFVVRTGPAEATFKSPSVREIVVDALPVDGARVMHAAAGDALAMISRDAPDQAARIASHLYEAGDRPRAASFFGKSGEERLKSRHLDAAARDFARAIELADERTAEPAVLLGWLSGLASAVRLVRAAPEAESMCERVIAAVDRGSDLGMRVRARIEAGRLLSALNSFDSANAQFSQAEYIAGDRADLQHQALLASAELASQKGDFRRALATLERVTALDAKPTDRTEEHKLYLSLAQANAATGNAVAARSFLDRADALRVDGPSTCERVRARCFALFCARDYRGAAGLAERAVELGREYGLLFEVALNLHVLGETLVRLFDYPRAYGAFKQSLTASEEAGFDRLANHARMFIAFLDVMAGDHEAIRALSNAISYAEANAYSADVLNGRKLVASVYRHRGDRENARREYERLRDLARELGYRTYLDDAEEALLTL